MENISGEVRSVKLDMEACSVCFTAGEGTGLKGVEYTGDKKLAPEISLDNGILKITQKGTGVIMSIMKPRLTVTIGKDTILNNLDIRLNAGDIKINGIAADWFSEVIGAGNINISDSSFLKSEIISKTGNIDIRNTNLDMVVIEANVGNVKLDAAEDLDRYGIDCKVYTGNIRVGNDSCSGEFRSEEKGTGYIRIKVNVGCITVV